MIRLKCLIATLALALLLSTTTTAGEIQMPTATQPSPSAGEIQAPTGYSSPSPGDIQGPTSGAVLSNTANGTQGSIGPWSRDDLGIGETLIFELLLTLL